MLINTKGKIGVKNIEFHLNAQSGATLTFNLYGCIYRIG